MIISKNSQLGLKIDALHPRKKFLECWIDCQKKNHKEYVKRYRGLSEEDALKFINEISALSSEQRSKMKVIDDRSPLAKELGFNIDENEGRYVLQSENEEYEKVNIINDNLEIPILSNSNSEIFLITESVYTPAGRVKIGENFTCTLMQNIRQGMYTYLLGKNEMIAFVHNENIIKGLFYNDLENIAFEFGYDTKNDNYYYPKEYNKQFTKITQLITFIELGDIEIKILPPGRNNNKPKNEGKVHNSSNFTVYVVDSSWNQLIVRTEGFAVLGHFRLQPYGPSHSLRKLIWIDAFEKHGYVRRPKAEIRD